MNRAELESKHLAELHALAAEAGVPRYRMLSRAELVERLASGDGSSARQREASERPAARERGARRPRREGDAAASDRGASAVEAPPPRRRRRRRRFRRRGKELRAHQLLLPASSGRQMLLCAETREGCTQVLRELAAELSAAAKGPDPVVLLVDPSPEEIADWRRDAPMAEIVVAGQARHADDALAQASGRAAGGEDVILLIDSLSRLGEAFGDAGAVKEFFDAGREVDGGDGSLTIVGALERGAEG